MTVYGCANEMTNCYLRRVVRDDVLAAPDAVGHVVEVNRYFNCPSLE